MMNTSGISDFNADGLSLPLRPSPVQDSRSDSLPSLIARINDQRGHFRSVTEDGLRTEIDTGEGRGERPYDEENGSAEDDPIDAKGRREDVLAAREEMVKYISQAQMEALYALDFVSLLLSKHTPKQAEVSMSPYLQQHAPKGSLGMEKVQNPQLPDAEKQDQELVSRGWKLQGLQSSADSLLRSAARLEKEMEHEARYWEQVLSVSEKGWAVCRVPGEGRTLGVRFGFAEASPEFKHRGFAALRRIGDGTLMLDQGLASTQPKAIRVRVETSPQNVAYSQLPSLAAVQPTSLEDRILQARNTVYEEELFYELAREARTVVNQGVRIIGSTIHLPRMGDEQISIDLVSLNDSNDSTADPLTAPSNPLEKRAESIVTCLRILLSYAHRQNLHRRSEIPQPLTDRKQATPIYSIIRPVLTHLQHRSVVQSIQTFLDNFTAPLQSAGFPTKFSFDLATNFNFPLRANGTTKKLDFSSAETLVGSLLNAIESSVHLTLPSGSSLTIAIYTHIHPPTLGTEYRVSINSTTTTAPLKLRAPSTMRFASAVELESFISHTCTIDLTSVISSSPSSSSDSKVKEPTSPSPAHHHHNHAHSAWEPSAQLGELTKSFATNPGRVRRLHIQLLPERGEYLLILRWGWLSGRPAEGTHAWHGKHGERDFFEVVAEAGKSDAE
ncbi:hypothetical protein L228DRAFT_247063 [Xylona heveae TC161]|uniref:Mediator of RNA polymerase II transcription subunit 17 n=1 Tax=Xylona heveae (strain CBS 132557 / TC161) TaxID=1328760 RepID=A0A165GWQ0_XYLHT|nr:hypothetical protein L228DRAFT_247063 [Xylona heveae TC161]KZF22695.1 hypothetical protein L228DRAFT_247063 [Xylona heveae TC161]